MLLVLALAIFVGAGPAPAQDLLFKTLTIDYYKFGASTIRSATWGADTTWGTGDDIGVSPGVDGIWGTGDDNANSAPIVSASAILCASNTLKNSDDKYYVWDFNADGKIDTSSAASVDSVPNHARFLSQTMSRPIMSNITRGEQLYLAAIIENVTPADVASLRDGTQIPATNGVMNDIINMVTADFSAGLFANNTPSTYFQNVHPTYATTTYDIRDKVNGGVFSSTSVVVYWDIAGFAVGATDSVCAAQSYSATMAIWGSRAGKSNFVGIETGINSAPVFLTDWSKSTQLVQDWQDDLNYSLKRGSYPGVDMGIRIEEQIDTTSNRLFGSWAANPTNDPAIFIGRETYAGVVQNVPFQFRSYDQMNVELQIDARESLDGEPNEYFGGSSDPVQVDESTGAGVALGKFKGGKLQMSAWQPRDLSNVFENVRYKALSAVGAVNGVNLSTVVDVTAAISDKAITSSTYQVFVVKAIIQDEVGSATEAFTNHALDTAAPFVTDTRAAAERGSSIFTNGDVGFRSATRDEAIFGVEIDGNGESPFTTNVAHWLNLQFRDTARLAAWFTSGTGSPVRFSNLYGTDVTHWNDPALYNMKDIAPANVVLATQVLGSRIKNIPGTDFIQGASVVIRIKTNVSSSMNSGGLIFCASDDARNPAIVYYGSESTSENSPFVDTTRKFYSFTNFTPKIYSTINPATVEIDNEPPQIIAASLGVIGLPSGYWNAGDPADSFEAFRANSVESRTNTAVNSGKMVVRGTAKSASQGGSPLRLVVKFKPVGDTTKAGEDLDGRPFVAATVAQRVAGFNERFAMDIANANLGYVTTGIGANVFASDTSKTSWTIEDATIICNPDPTHPLYPNQGWVAANSIGYVTYVETVGIPTTDGNYANAKMQLGFGDGVYNFYDTATAVADANYKGIVLDTVKPSVNLNNSVFNDPLANNTIDSPMYVVDGKFDGTFMSSADAAETALYLVNYNGGLAIPAINFATNIFNFSQTISAVPNSFYNSPDVTGSTVPMVQAGYSIIVSASFVETPLGAGNEMFTQIGIDGTSGYSYSGFPFLFGAIGASDDRIALATTPSYWKLDAAGTLYGRAFKTITANFGDFVDEDYAKDVLPDSTAVVAGGVSYLNTSVAAPADITVATWFFYLDGTKNLNVKASNVIRAVTFTARDLSGNVTKRGVQVARANFAQPAVTILDYEIDNPVKGIRRAVVQRDSSYLGGAGVAAVSLSQATMNVNSASVMIVAKIGDGISKGGPLKSSDFLSINFDLFGGGVEYPDIITNASGVVITNGAAVAPSDILYATWWTDKFTPSNTLMDTGGQATAKLTVQAIASSLGIGKAVTSVGVQVDHFVPTPTVSPIVEKTAADARDTQPYGDQNGDGVIRPNQIVSFTAEFPMDQADLNNTSLIQFVPDMSQFGNTTPIVYTQTKSGGIRSATIQFTVPSDQHSDYFKVITYATDAAGNFGSGDTGLVQVNASRPQIQSIVMSASTMVNFATYTVGATNQWRRVGYRLQTDPSNPTVYEASGMVRAGDALMVTATININDSIFSDLVVYADFSKFSGPAFARVQPLPYSSPTNDTIQQGTRVAGNIYYATWYHLLQPSDQHIVDASVKIIASNFAGVDSIDGIMSYSVPITVDNKGPVVTEKLVVFKNGVPSSGEVNPNDLKDKSLGGYAFSVSPGRATAEIVVSATYEDAGTRFGYASSLFHALWFGPNQLNVNSKQAQDAVFKLNDQDVAQTTNPQAALFALSDKSGVFNNGGSSTDGEVISSATPIDSVSTASGAVLKASTQSVINIWWGKDPSLPYGNSKVDSATAVVIKEEAYKTGVKLITSVQDVIGNVSTDSSLAEIEVDGRAPEISISRKTDESGATIGHATLDVAPGQEPYVNYVPAQYAANGDLQRPTRVSQGTIVRLLTHVFDLPDMSDEITFSVNGNEFASKASNFVIYSPTPGQRTDISLSTPDNWPNRDKIWMTKIDKTILR